MSMIDTIKEELRERLVYFRERLLLEAQRIDRTGL